MKKTMILFAMAVLFLSCKKEEVIPDQIDISVGTEIWRYDNYKRYYGLDSVKFDLYEKGSATPVFSGYTGSSGILTLSLRKNTEYTLNSITRTYSNSGTSGTHYYVNTATFWSSREIRNEVFIQKGWTTYYHYPLGGIGSSVIPIQDPTE